MTHIASSDVYAAVFTLDAPPLYGRLIGRCDTVDAERVNILMWECRSRADKLGRQRGKGRRPEQKKYVSKYFHGFFITINSMILYFKHIIHINDFPLNWHPPSILICVNDIILAQPIR